MRMETDNGDAAPPKHSTPALIEEQSYPKVGDVSSTRPAHVSTPFNVCQGISC